MLAAVERAGPDLRWFVLDMLPITGVDATGFFVMSDVSAKLRARGITVVLAGRQTEYENWAAQRGVQDDDEAQYILRFPTLRQAMRAYTLQDPTHAANES